MKKVILILNFVVIKHKTTKQVWAAHVLPNDQDNEIYLSTEQDYYNADMQEFIANFVGSRNARYFKDTENFEVIIEQREIIF